MQIDWKIDGSKAELDYGVYTAEVSVTGHTWLVSILHRDRVNGQDPEAQATGKSTSHEAAKLSASEACKTLLTTLTCVVSPEIVGNAAVLAELQKNTAEVA